jgi:hypothetical protein
VTNSDFSSESNRVEVLDDLAKRVRAAHKAIEEASANALSQALAAGDALIEAKNRGVGSIGWERWVSMHCLLPLSTARLFMQLARNRPHIETALKQDPLLSLRAARRLVSKPKEPKEKQEPEEENIPEPVIIPAITDAQLIEGLTARGPDWFISNMPDGWREKLQAYLRGHILRAEQKAHPNTRTKHLKLVHTDRPTTQH